MKKQALLSTAFILFSGFCMQAFEWPQAETTADSIHSEFGQLRGGVLSSSIIYKDIAQIHASDEGTITAVITNHDDDFGWFESSLGTTVIISHGDGLSTVYSNLDDDYLNSNLTENLNIKAREDIGKSGYTAWQEKSNGLEFKVYDRKNLSAVNPKLLMPRIAREVPLETGGLTLVDKNGTAHNVAQEKRLAAGTYLIYKTRQTNAVPFKTIVAVNGESVETIVYDTLKVNEGFLGVNGNNHYAINEVYPDNDKFLLAKAQLSKGQNTLTVTLVNIQENAVSVTYKLDIY